MAVNNTKEYRELFWDKIEKSLCCTIPNYVKNIFKVQNLDNPIALSGVNEDIVKELQEFVRTDVYKSTIPSTDDNSTKLSDFYGIYDKYPTQFQFTIGDKLMIFKVKDFVANKKSGFWKTIKQSTKTSSRSAITSPMTPTQEQSATSLNYRSEAKKIFKLLNKGKNTLPDIKASLNSIEIDIAMENERITATIQCSQCKNKIKTMKKMDRWDIYNFRRHFFKHSTQHNNNAKKALNKSKDNKSTRSSTSKLTKKSLQKNIKTRTHDSAKTSRTVKPPLPTGSKTRSSTVPPKVPGEVQITPPSEPPSPPTVPNAVKKNTDGNLYENIQTVNCNQIIDGDTSISNNSDDNSNEEADKSIAKVVKNTIDNLYKL